MALPFLPPEQIEETFHHLDRRAGTAPLLALMDFIWRQWIRNPVFPVPNWSVFMLTVRTNNDLERWHNRLNARVCRTGRVPFYLLLIELYHPFGCPTSLLGEDGKDQQEEDQPAEWELSFSRCGLDYRDGQFPHRSFSELVLDSMVCLSEV